VHGSRRARTDGRDAWSDHDALGGREQDGGVSEGIPPSDPLVALPKNRPALAVVA
jgi:hypothetical protein